MPWVLEVGGGKVLGNGVQTFSNADFSLSTHYFVCVNKVLGSSIVCSLRLAPTLFVSIRQLQSLPHYARTTGISSTSVFGTAEARAQPCYNEGKAVASPELVLYSGPHRHLACARCFSPIHFISMLGRHPGSKFVRGSIQGSAKAPRLQTGQCRTIPMLPHLVACLCGWVTKVALP